MQYIAQAAKIFITSSKQAANIVVTAKPDSSFGHISFSLASKLAARYRDQVFNSTLSMRYSKTLDLGHLSARIPHGYESSPTFNGNPENQPGFPSRPTHPTQSANSISNSDSVN
jgi:hypothetical protein